MKRVLLLAALLLVALPSCGSDSKDDNGTEEGTENTTEEGNAGQAILPEVRYYNLEG